MANEAHEAHEAIKADEVANKVNEAIMANEADEVDKAYGAEAYETDGKAGDAKVTEAYLPNETDKTKAYDANKAKAYKVDKAVVANAANEVNVIDEIIAANINHLSKLIKYSLTKCSVTFAKMKEYFGITTSNFLNLRSIRICS